MGGYWKAYRSVVGAGTSWANRTAEDLARRSQANRLRPSRAALKTGILCPGDGPPAGSLGAFADYREILLPADLSVLRTGDFPLGKVMHPRAGAGEFPIFLDWGELANHVAVVGPSGTGKTFGLLAPWAAAAASRGVTSVVVDVKGDFVQEIKVAKDRLGIGRPLKVATWDIDSPSTSRPWNPLAEISSSQHTAQVVEALLGEVDPADPQKWFAERDHRWLRGLLTLLTATRGRGAHPAELYRLAVHQAGLLAMARQAPGAAGDLLDLVQFSQSDFAKATSGLATKLSWLADPVLASMLSGQGPRALTVDAALDSGAIIVIGARLSGGERSLMAASLLINLLRLRCLERFRRGGSPVLWLLDEAPRYRSRIQLEQMLDTLRGANSPVCVAMQDVEQFGDAGQQNRVLSNCDVFVALRGVSDSTSKFFANRLGTTQVLTVTNTLGSAGGQWNPTAAHVDRLVLGQREIMYPPVGNFGGVVQVRRSSPRPFLVTFD
jgi:type IV secretory pathway TraG/TraD family ATPase VirD4